MTRTLVYVFACVACSAILVAAQAPDRWDQAKETTISGVVLHVDSFASADGVVGVHLEVRTAAGEVNVHVGPAMFIGTNNFSFLADDHVDVVGARIARDGNVAIWARQITKDGKTLALRSDGGTPKWTPNVDGTDGCGVAHPGLPRLTER